MEYFVQCRQKVGSAVQFVKFWKYLKLVNRQGYKLLPTLVRLLYQFPCSSFKNIIGRTDLSDQFRKVMICCKSFGYNLNVVRQSTCLMINPILVDNFAALFNCKPVV